VAGLAAAAAGLGLIALAPGALPIPAVLAALGLAGLGFGICSPALEAAALETAGRRDAGLAAGLLGTAGYLGSLLGTVLLIGPAAPDGGPDGFSALYLTLAVMAAAACGGTTRAAAPLRPTGQGWVSTPSSDARRITPSSSGSRAAGSSTRSSDSARRASA
jgi:hypothetical protein